MNKWDKNKNKNKHTWGGVIINKGCDVSLKNINGVAYIFQNMYINEMFFLILFFIKFIRKH